MIKCSMCSGYGDYQIIVLWKGIGGGPYEPCPLCNGKGKITQKQRMEYIRSFKGLKL